MFHSNTHIQTKLLQCVAEKICFSNSSAHEFICVFMHLDTMCCSTEQTSSMHEDICVNFSVQNEMRSPVHEFIYVYVDVYRCVGMYVCVRECECVCVCTCVCMYMCM